jgi:pyruvate formate lyase activating enzyme
MMVLGGIQKNSLIDYPGKISCVLFTAGCNFRCPYCHNPSLVTPHTGVQKLEIQEDEIFSFLDNRRTLLEGVVLSGGEPTLWPDIVPFCEKVKQMGYPVKLDTNGSRPKVLDHLIRKDLVDYIAMDIKTLPEFYQDFFIIDCGPRDILSSIQLIMGCGKDHEFRTTCVKPIVNDRIIIGIARLIQGSHLYALQKFVSRDVLRPEFFQGSGSGHSAEELFHFKSIAEKWVEKCIVRC